MVATFLSRMDAALSFFPFSRKCIRFAAADSAVYIPCSGAVAGLARQGRKGLLANLVDGNIRKNIFRGARVAIVLKRDQQSGRLTDGIVEEILTNSATHPHGVKVRLATGEVGRVKEIYPKADPRQSPGN